MTADDLWTRLGWRRATALSIHFFSTLHPTTVPCLAYDEEGWTIYMFSMAENGPAPWPDRTEMGMLGPVDCPRAVEIFVRGPNGQTSASKTDWPNATNASVMLSFSRLWAEGRKLTPW